MSYAYTKTEADSLARISIQQLNTPSSLYGVWFSYAGGTDAEISLVGDIRNDPEARRKYVAFLFDEGKNSFMEEAEKYFRYRYTKRDEDGNKIKIDRKTFLTSTPCNFGGVRYWFECPCCLRRTGVLYFFGGTFACRICHHLTYECRNLSGRSKDSGRIISLDELQRTEKQVKRKYYNGKMTRKYKIFLKKESRFAKVFWEVAAILNN